MNKNTQITFEYSREKDIWCLLNKGKSSNNSQQSTKVYQQLVVHTGENPTADATSLFIEQYIAENHIDFEEYITKYQSEWDVIADEYKKRAESVFGVKLPTEVKGYLTINNRCPYNIADGYFFVSVPSSSANKTVMHELWHFYTWYGLGVDQEAKLGKEKYNELKEALTVLLNVECDDLMPEGTNDNGYPQHKELREVILRFWENDKSIQNLWEYLTNKV